MSKEEGEDQLRRATEEVISAEKALRDLAEKVKTYPEAAQRLQEVCDSLQRASNGIQSAAFVMSNHMKAMEQTAQRVDSAIERMESVRVSMLAANEQSAKNADAVKRDLASQIEVVIERIVSTHSATLAATKAISTAMEQQAPMIEKAAGKRGILF